jgi:acyl-CoA synthetase (AMP-forming)/AMP-acid ligase II
MYADPEVHIGELDRSAEHGWRSLVDLLRTRAESTPERLAYTFLLDGETKAASLTYRELDRRAQAVAVGLRNVAEPGDRALLLFPPGLDYIAGFLGCLYAGVVAVPVYPPRLNRPDPRLEVIAADARPAVALTTPGLAAMLAGRLPAALAELAWLTCEGDSPVPTSSWLDPGAGAATLAFLQYTSGSTAMPRGVMVTHGNLLHNLAAIQVNFGFSPDDHFVSWLPPYHDMGLIGGILEPLYGGFPSTLMSPMDFLQRPARWPEALSRYGGTVGGGPNFAFDLCVSRTRPEQRTALDLSRWAVAFNGAEPVRPATLERFAAAFEPAGFRPEAFRPCYGLAEGTLMVSGGLRGALPCSIALAAGELAHHRVVPAASREEDARHIAGCGRLIRDTRVVIVDPETCRPCAPDRPGEIWAAGPSVAAGYWNRPEETAHTFGGILEPSGEAPFLRTGDLGFLRDGELYVTGRLKDLIIVDGRNHYPQDIEATVEGSHPAVRAGCCAAFALEGEKERVVVVVEVDHRWRQPVDPVDMAQAIRRAVHVGHDLPVHEAVLVQHGSVPKTTSGKTQMRFCRELYLQGRLAAWTGGGGAAATPGASLGN